MPSRAIVQQDNNGEVKQKNVIADGRNCRVLQDIGNFVNERAGQGKKPITEGFAAVAQAKKGGGGGAVAQVVAAQKKVVDKVDKPKPETVIVISSNEKTEKSKNVSGREGSSRKEVKILTSIISARSKAACDLTNKPKASIEDIDGADVGNELAVNEYVYDIYKFYKLSEDEGGVHNYMDLHPDINAKIRSILVDWLIEVHRKFDLMPETLYLTLNIVDRFLSVKVVPRKELQLVGISAMLIACKYEEIWASEVNDFIFISDNAYARELVLIMEKESNLG